MALVHAVPSWDITVGGGVQPIPLPNLPGVLVKAGTPITYDSDTDTFDPNLGEVVTGWIDSDTAQNFYLFPVAALTPVQYANNITPGATPSNPAPKPTAKSDGIWIALALLLAAALGR